MKHLNKTALAAALTLAATTSALAVEPITVFGKVNLSVESINDRSSDFDSKTDVVSNASRFGVKGGYSLSDSLTAVYNLEWGVNVSDDAASKGNDNISARNQYVGLEGDFGQLLVGRNDTVLKQSQGKVDLFNDLRGDLGTLFKGENRTGDSLTYKTPRFSGFQAGATWVTEGNGKAVDKNGKATDGASLAVWYGDESLKESAVYAALAYDSKIGGYEVLRASLQGALGDLILGGIYQRQEQVVANADSYDGFLLSASYALGDFKPLVQYQDMEELGHSTSVGLEYKLGKPTKAYLFYTVRSFDNEVKSSVANSIETDDSERYLGIGIDHRF